MNDNLIIFIFLLIYFSPVLYQVSIVIKESKKGNKVPLIRLKKIIKYSLYVIVPVSFVFGLLIHTNYLDYEKPMGYEEYDNISFENFRGLEFFKKSLYGNERFAYVVTSIETDFEDKAVSIEALFHPSRSFVYNKNTNSLELLTHEKYHFKITELFVRKAKKKISDLEFFDKNRITEIIKDHEKGEVSFQKKYDEDTFHSYILGEQKRYEREIDSLLTLLSDFEKRKIEFNE